MKRLFLIAVVLLPALSFAAGQTTNKKKDAGAENEVAIRKVIGDFTAVWNKHDAKAFSMLFAKDADFTNVSGMSASGRTEIEKFHAPRFASAFKNSHLMATETRIRFVKSDVAAVDVEWEMTGATDREGQTIALRKGLLSFVMVKENDKWLIVVMHNMNLPSNP